MIWFINLLIFDLISGGKVSLFDEYYILWRMCVRMLMNEGVEGVIDGKNFLKKEWIIN